VSERPIPAENPVVLASIGPDVLAACAAGLVYLFARGGLIAPGPGAAVLIGVLAGIAAALAASSAVRSALAAGVVVLVGGLVAPIFAMAMLPAAVVGGAVAASTAFCVRWIVDAGVLRASLVVAIGVVLVLGSFWFSTAVLARDQAVVDGQTMYQFLTTVPKADVEQPDQYFYNAVLFKMRNGETFYSAYREAFHENALWKADPPTIIAVREPLLPVMLAALPGDGRAPIWAMAALASAAIVASFWLPRNLMPPALRLTSVVGVAAYTLAFTTTPLAIGFEPWGACLGVLSAALFSASMSTRLAENRRRMLVASAVVLAILAVSVREIMIFLPVAGLIGSFFAEKERRRFDVLAWALALLGCVAVWGIHAYLARSIVTPSDVMGAAWVFGGVDNVIAAVKYAAFYVTTYRPLLALLTLLGVLGAFMQKERQYRVFMLGCVLLPLLTFFFAWNEAIDNSTGAQVNYWGIVMGPLLFAMIPAALGVIPVLRTATESVTDPATEAAAETNLIA